MDHYNRLVQQIWKYVFLLQLLSNIVIAGLLWLLLNRLDVSTILALLIVALVGALGALAVAALLTPLVTEPIRFLSQAILHVVPSHSGTPAPNLEQSRIGRELVTSLSLQIYQLASSAPLAGLGSSQTDTAGTIADHIPLPLLVIDKAGVIQFANEAARNYLNRPAGELLKKDLYSTLDLLFPNEQTFDAWLADCRANKVTATQSWDRVRLKLANQSDPLQFDMAAYYSKDAPNGAETIITFFDHTQRYSQDDEAASYVALAVHELRTPLTILRGYIEVFEEELAGKLNPEFVGFMDKMQASAQSLAAFVNNILNVARVEENQLTLELHEESWEAIVKGVVDDMQLRAQVYGKSITYDVSPDLPKVAVDKVSIYEVLNNLLDNAIKYSGSSNQIIIKSSLSHDGLIETTVQDFGVGIPESVMPQLFDKFYRSHRSRAQVGGTGLGLYLSKAIVKAHGGQIWVRSKEGQGSTFGFTLVSFDKLGDELKDSDNKEIVRGAHGWIKNHSLYRR